MISEEVENILLKNADCFLVSDDKVAHVMDENPLTHALLMLTQVKYTRIPVLNREGHIVGLIGLSNIVNQMFDLADIDPTNLEGLLVKDVMDTEVPIVTDPFDVEDILHKLVDHPFLAVVDEYNCFTGIVTRREILKSINHLVHEIELDNS